MTRFCVTGIAVLLAGQLASGGAPVNVSPHKKHRALTEDEARRVIERQYDRVLHRRPDSAGMRAFTRELTEGGRGERWLRTALENSPERRAMVRRRNKRMLTLGLRLALVSGFVCAAWLFCRRFPGLVRRLCAWAAISLISLASGEIALRMYHYFKPSYIFYDATYTRFKARPFARDWDFRLNSRGYKDQEFSVRKTRRWRVLGIGDSFAFGVVPYRWNYHTRLEEMLTESGRNVEVLNMGIPRIGPREYLDVLLREGMNLDPDWVMVSFFVGNDFIDVVDWGTRRNWYEYSFVASLIHYLICVRPEYQGREARGAPTYRDDAPTLSEKAFMRIERQRSLIFRRGNTGLRQFLPMAVEYLAEMQRACVRRRIGFLVVIIPDELQINSDLQRSIVAWADASGAPAQWDWAQPNTLLAEELGRRGIDHIDLYERFAAEGGDRRLYKPRDTHWNIAGNELAARSIFEWMSSRLTGPDDRETPPVRDHLGHAPPADGGIPNGHGGNEPSTGPD